MGLGSVVVSRRQSTSERAARATWRFAASEDRPEPRGFESVDRRSRSATTANGQSSSSSPLSKLNCSLTY